VNFVHQFIGIANDDIRYTLKPLVIRGRCVEITYHQRTCLLI